jgi:hypothetical protein
MSQVRPSASDDSSTRSLANIADLPCLPLHFNAVEARLPHDRQTAVWRYSCRS